MDSTYSGDDLPQWSQYKYYGLMGTTTGKQCVAAGRKTDEEVVDEVMNDVLRKIWPNAQDPKEYPRPRRNLPSRRNTTSAVAASTEYPRRGRVAAVTSLRDGLHGITRQPRRYRVTRWPSDPWTYGAYPYYPKVRRQVVEQLKLSRLGHAHVEGSRA